jgi:hypothetical protein
MGDDDQAIFEQLAHRGFAVVPGAVTAHTVSTLIAAIEVARPDPGLRQKNSRVYAMRNLLGLVPEVRKLARSSEMSGLVAPVLGQSARVVRGLLFDKTPEANWKGHGTRTCRLRYEAGWTSPATARGP